MSARLRGDPLESNGQVHGLVGGLDERGNQHLKVRATQRASWVRRGAWCKAGLNVPT